MPESDGTDDVAAALAEDITSHIAEWPSVSDLIPDETVTLRIGYLVDDDRGSRGPTVQAHFAPVDLAQEITDILEGYIDKRKFKMSDNGRHRNVETWTIGSVTVNGDTEIESIDIDSKYLKPSIDSVDGGE